MASSNDCGAAGGAQRIPTQARHGLEARQPLPIKKRRTEEQQQAVVTVVVMVELEKFEHKQETAWKLSSHGELNNKYTDERLKMINIVSFEETTCSFFGRHVVWNKWYRPLDNNILVALVYYV